MKIDVVTMDKEEKAKGRGIYDESKRKMGPKVSRMPTSKLAETKRLTSPIQEGTRTNEPHFSSKERRTATESSTITRVIVNQVNIDEKEQVANNAMDAEGVELPREELTEEDQDLKEMFIIQLENLTHSSKLQIETKEKLPKAKFDNPLNESTKGVLDIYLKEVGTILQNCESICESVCYGESNWYQVRKVVKSYKGERKKKIANGGKTRGRKFKKEIKELCQIVAKTSNELYRRRQRRKAIKKEKKIIKELIVLIDKDTTNYNLRNAREQWLDKLRYKKIKLTRCEEKRRRKQDNIMFQWDQNRFFRMMEGEQIHKR